MIKIKIRFLGGCDGIGKSAVLLDNTVLDYGLQTSNKDPFPVKADCDHAIISHGHLDHCGAVPALKGVSDIYMTAPTGDFMRILTEDTIRLNEKWKNRMIYSMEDLTMAMAKIRNVSYEEPFFVGDQRCTLTNAGHIVGSSSILVEGDIDLFYSSDVNMIDTKMAEGAKDFPRADVGIVESTYFGTNHSPREELEEKFADSVKETVEKRGNVIIPCFAINRTQEILIMLEEKGISPFLDGMGVEATKIILSHPEFAKDPSALKKAFDNAILVNRKNRRDVFSEPSVIVTTAGMMNGGPVINYLKKIYKDPKSKLILTGYQVEGTNGRMVLEKGLVRLNKDIVKIENDVEQYDFSSHSGDKELKEMVKDLSDKGATLFFTIHGEREKNEAFSAWIKEEIGCEANAPNTGDTYAIS